eukprot:gene9849-6921_t
MLNFSAQERDAGNKINASYRLLLLLLWLLIGNPIGLSPLFCLQKTPFHSASRRPSDFPQERANCQRPPLDERNRRENGGEHICSSPLTSFTLYYFTTRRFSPTTNTLTSPIWRTHYFVSQWGRVYRRPASCRRSLNWFHGGLRLHNENIFLSIFNYFICSACSSLYTGEVCSNPVLFRLFLVSGQMLRATRRDLVVFTQAYPELEAFAQRFFLPSHPLRYSPIWLDENDFSFNQRVFERFHSRFPLVIDNTAHDKLRSPYSPLANSSVSVRRAAKEEADFARRRQMTLEGTGGGPGGHKSNPKWKRTGPYVPVCAMRIDYPLLLLNADQVELADRGYGNASARLRVHVAKLLHTTGGPGVGLAGYAGADGGLLLDGDADGQSQRGGSGSLFGGEGTWGRAAISASPGVSSYFPSECATMMNAHSGKPYLDKTVADALERIRRAERYSSHWWATIDQWKAIGASPRYGSDFNTHRVVYHRLTKLVHISLLKNPLEVLKQSQISLHMHLFRCRVPWDETRMEELMTLYRQQEQQELEEYGVQGGCGTTPAIGSWLTQIPKKDRTNFISWKDMNTRYQNLCALLLQTETGKVYFKSNDSSYRPQPETENTASVEEEHRRKTSASKTNKRKRKNAESNNTNNKSDAPAPAATVEATPASLKEAIATFIPLYFSSAFVHRLQLSLREDATPVAEEPSSEAMLPDAMEILGSSPDDPTGAAAPAGTAAALAYTATAAPRSQRRPLNSASGTEVGYFYHIGDVFTPAGDVLEPPEAICAALLRHDPLTPVHGVTGAPLTHAELQLAALHGRHTEIAARLERGAEEAREHFRSPSPAEEEFDAEEETKAKCRSRDHPLRQYADSAGGGASAASAARKTPLVHRSIWFKAEDVLTLSGIVNVNSSPVEVRHGLQAESSAAPGATPPNSAGNSKKEDRSSAAQPSEEHSGEGASHINTRGTAEALTQSSERTLERRALYHGGGKPSQVDVLHPFPPPPTPANQSFNASFVLYLYYYYFTLVLFGCWLFVLFFFRGVPL